MRHQTEGGAGQPRVESGLPRANPAEVLVRFTSFNTFRVFVSSPFSDLGPERNALQRHVFPRLVELCAREGYRFHAIDLRWGIREEATLDHRTMSVCLGEVARCQQTTRAPNFLLLLGERYGSRLLPARLPVDTADRLMPPLSTDMAALFETWYRRDENARPAEYLLQPRHGEFVAPETWSREVANPLARALRHAAATLLDWTEHARHFGSPTEQEVLAGILSSRAPQERAFAYFRAISNRDDVHASATASEEARRLVDFDQEGHLDLEAQGALATLKARVRAVIPGHCTDLAAQWTGTHLTTTHLGDLPTDLDECLDLVHGPRVTLCHAVWTQLATAVLDEIRGARASRSSQSSVAPTGSQAGVKPFHGNVEVLATVLSRLREDREEPLVLVGEPGSGKTAVLGEAARVAATSLPDGVVLLRTLGSSTETLSASRLAGELADTISSRFAETRTDSSLPSVNAENDGFSLAHLLDRVHVVPLCLMIDGLEKLPADDVGLLLQQLPIPCPEGVRIVVSCTAGPALTALSARFPNAPVLPVAPLATSEGAALLDDWMSQAGRRLTGPQRDEVLRAFAVSGSPGVLKLAFERAVTWTSYDAPVSLPSDALGLGRQALRIWSDRANHGTSIVARVAMSLRSSRYGLAEHELLDILADDSEFVAELQRDSRHAIPEGAHKIPVALWSRLYFDLEPYLLHRVGPDGLLLTFHDQTMLDAVDLDCAVALPKKTAHARLAAFFARRRQMASDSVSPLGRDRWLAELPFQWAGAKEARGLYELLTDCRFLEAKIAAGLGEDLLQDFARATTEVSGNRSILPNLRVLGAAIATGLPHLVGDPSSVGAQMLFEMRQVRGSNARALASRITRTMADRPALRWRSCSHVDVPPVDTHLRGFRYPHFLEFSPDGHQLLCVTGDGRVTRWNLRERVVSHSWAPAEDLFRSAVLVSARTLLVVGTEQIWRFDVPDIWHGHLKQGSWTLVLRSERGPSGPVIQFSGAGFARDAGYVLVGQASAGRRRLLRLEAQRCRVVDEWPLPGPGSVVNDIALSHDGQTRVLVKADGALITSAGWLGEAHPGGAFQCRLAHADRRVLTAGSDGSVAAWDRRDGLLDRIVPRFRDGADALAWSETAGVGAVGWRKGDVALFQLSDAGKLKEEGRFTAGVRGWVLRAAFSDDGRRLALAGREGAIQVVDVRKLRRWTARRARRADPPWPIWPCAILARGTGASFHAGERPDRRLYSTVNLQDEPFPLRCSSSVLDPASDALVCAVAGSLEAIDPRSGKRRTLRQLTERDLVSSMAISADGRFLAVMTDRAIDVYRIDVRAGTCHPVRSLDIAPALSARNIPDLRSGVPLAFARANEELWLALEPRYLIKAGGPDGLHLPEWPDPDHALGVFNLSDGAFRDPAVHYRGWCHRLVEAIPGQLMALGIGQGNVNIERFGQIEAVFGSGGDSEVRFHRISDGALTSRCAGAPSDLGVLDVACDDAGDRFVAAFREGRVRVGSIAAGRWLASIHFIDPILAVRVDPHTGRIWVADDGGSASNWPSVHELELAVPAAGEQSS